MKKSELYGITGSVTIVGLLILLLFLLVMPGLKEPEDEGIMVSFGEVDMGSGKTETPTEQPTVKAVTPPPATPKAVKQEVMTQDDNSLAIAEQKKKDKREKEALERQRLEEQRIANEKKKAQQDAIDKAKNALDGAFSNSNSAGSGNTSGDKPKGNPAGSGSSNGNDWNLAGRGLIGGIVKPRYESSTIGKITIQIKVDKNGTVTDAIIYRPTTIGDADIRNDAIKAAKKVKFTEGNSEQYGTIVFNYINY